MVSDSHRSAGRIDMPSPLLPPELLLDIVDALVLSQPSHANRIPNLAILARINRSFHSLTNPLLYRNLFLDTPRRFKILSTLSRNPSLLRHVRTLTISGGELSIGEFGFMKEVLSGCSNVSRLTYLCFDLWYLPSLTAFIGQTWSTQLRYLRSDSKEGLFHLLARLPNLEELVASRIDFPSNINSTRSSSIDTCSPPSLPSFHLKRIDSGSSPFAPDFDLLTRTSRTTLVDLDLPISSQSPLQDLSSFSALSSLTLSLAERYIPHSIDSRIGVPGGPARTDRDDVKCLRRVVEMLKAIERGGGGKSFRRLELYQPSYRRTREISASDVEESRLLEEIPAFVNELDLSTLEIDGKYLQRLFGVRESGVCRGLKRIFLKNLENPGEVERVMKERGIAVVYS
ncbi:hypothetical protein JCM3765_006882 [Sporobolomyces pararoseus]